MGITLTIIIGILVVIISFSRDWSNQQKTVAALGGMIGKYKILVDALLQMELVKVLQHDNDLIIMGYSSLVMQQKITILDAFGVVKIKYEYRDPYKGNKLEWQYPDGTNQEMIADKVINDITRYLEMISNAR